MVARSVGPLIISASNFQIMLYPANVFPPSKGLALSGLRISTREPITSDGVEGPMKAEARKHKSRTAPTALREASNQVKNEKEALSIGLIRGLERL